MDHRAHIAGLKTLRGHRSSQDDPFVFSDHDKRSLPTRIGCHQARRVKTSVDNPDRSHHPLATLLSLRRYSAIDNIFLAVTRIDHLHDLPHPSKSVECADQRFRILAREAERLEKLRLAAIVWMRGVQEVLEHLVSFDDGEVRVSKRHDQVLCRGAHRGSRETTPCGRLWNWAIGRLRTADVIGVAPWN